MRCTASVAGAALPAAPYDFNGDGYADLAVGVPDEAGGGAVNVLYGSHDGITAAGDQYWTQDSPGVKGVRAKGDKFGRAISSADFDRDGYADLAIGVPREPGAGATGSRGAVNVLYGSSSGLTGSGDQLLRRDSFAVPTGWFFGEVLLAAELTGDGYPDLVVGTPGISLVVVAGGPAGLQASGARVLDPTATAAPGGGFGGSLAAGDFDGDGHGDLVIGLPYTTIGAISGAGALQVVYGGPSGLDLATVQTWSQDSPGILDEAEIGYAYDADGSEGFGRILAVGDLDGDGHDDLAVGVPSDGLSEGVVNVIYGSASGLTPDGNQLWSTADVTVPGSFDETGSGRFASALAAGDLNHDGHDDLAVGSRGRSLAKPADAGYKAGVVTLLYGSATGLVAAGSTSVSQDSADVPGTAENGDWFGFELQIAQVGHSASEDLIVGVPGESTGSARWAGAVNVLYGRTSGVSGGLAQYWHQNSSGVKGSAATEEWFGRYLGH